MLSSDVKLNLSFTAIDMYAKLVFFLVKFYASDQGSNKVMLFPKVPKGLEMGIGTMTQGEKAIIYVNEPYLTESSFMDIDSFQEVQFEVELVQIIQNAPLIEKEHATIVALSHTVVERPFSLKLEGACLNASSSDHEKGKSKYSSNKITHGFHLVEGKACHDVEDYQAVALPLEK
ncbi:unnamed protein product [Victoria cruziana]